jgi:hypothetical protein
MTSMKREMPDRLRKWLLEAGEIETHRILSSDEEFDKWIKANPLTPEEQKEVAAMVARLRARLLKTAKDFVDRDSQEGGKP